MMPQRIKELSYELFTRLHGQTCDRVDYATIERFMVMAVEFGKSVTQPAAETPTHAMLKRLVMSYDMDDSMEFLAALTNARDALGLKLADEDEDRQDREVLTVNGYDASGNSVASRTCPPSAAETPPSTEAVIDRLRAELRTQLEARFAVEAELDALKKQV